MQGCSYEEMLSKADLVVIAQPLGTKDTTEKTSWQNIVPAFHVVGVESEFKVATILKGDKGTRSFVLHHYRAVDTRAEVLSGPTLLHFDPKAHHCFLLFLAREPDGRYAPVCGQIDPASFSVLELPSPAQ